jgi:purine-cytosine permease-like protein
MSFFETIIFVLKYAIIPFIIGIIIWYIILKSFNDYNYNKNYELGECLFQKKEYSLAIKYFMNAFFYTHDSKKKKEINKKIDKIIKENEEYVFSLLNKGIENET